MRTSARNQFAGTIKDMAKGPVARRIQSQWRILRCHGAPDRQRDHAQPAAANHAFASPALG